MIKKIIGGLFAVAVVVVIVFTAIGAGSYKSMLPEDLFKRSAEPAVEVVEPVQEESAAEVEKQDSMEMSNTAENAADVAESADLDQPNEQ